MPVSTAIIILLYGGISSLVAVRSNGSNEVAFNEGVSAEIRYTLPSVYLNFTDVDNVQTSTEMTSRHSHRVTMIKASLAHVLDFYNSELLAAHWNHTKLWLTAACQNDMDFYLRGLDDAKLWALKMDDASGRYATGWFWGNHYWTGSQALCENISPPQAHQPSNVTSSAFASREVFSPGQSTLTTTKYSNVYTTAPPFKLAFFSIKIRLNSSFTSEERLIYMGQCLPRTCTYHDVTHILEQTSKTSHFVRISVEAVKAPNDGFNLWHDSTFKIMFSVSVIVLVLVIMGTTLDLYVEQYRRPHRRPVHLRLDMGMPSESEKNSNSNYGFYVVNQDRECSSSSTSSSQSLETMGISCSNRAWQISYERLKCVLLSFSLRANMRSICEQRVGADTIPVLHGLKSMSMVWVILGHTCIIAFKYSDNMEFRRVIERDFLFQTISNGAFSVDTFFFTSGLLVSFLYFRAYAKRKEAQQAEIGQRSQSFKRSVVHFGALIVYRFVRLTTPYLYTLGLVELTMKWFHHNSIFETPTNDHENCPRFWWRNVLYINTLFPVEQMCMLWSWYLADDTQFYVIGAILLILATRHFKSAVAVLVVFLCSSWLTTGYIAYSNGHSPGSDDPFALFDKIYDKPWTRLGPYLIGMCTGWYLYRRNCQLFISRMGILSGWTMSAALLLALVYGLYESKLDLVTSAAYSSLSHSAWALGLAWIVVACTTGYGGFINSLLSSTVLYPLSRVTYCAYLIHPIVIRVMAMSMDSPLHLGTIFMIIVFMGQVVASYILAFVISLTFEAPIVSMLRLVTKNVIRKSADPNTTTCA